MDSAQQKDGRYTQEALEQISGVKPETVLDLVNKADFLCSLLDQVDPRFLDISAGLGVVDAIKEVRGGVNAILGNEDAGDSPSKLCLEDQLKFRLEQFLDVLHDNVPPTKGISDAVFKIRLETEVIIDEIKVLAEFIGDR